MDEHLQRKWLCRTFRLPGAVCTTRYAAGQRRNSILPTLRKYLRHGRTTHIGKSMPPPHPLTTTAAPPLYPRNSHHQTKTKQHNPLAGGFASPASDTKRLTLRSRRQQRWVPIFVTGTNKPSAVHRNGARGYVCMYI